MSQSHGATDSELGHIQKVLKLIERNQKKDALEMLRSKKLTGSYELIQKQLEAEILRAIGERDRAEWCYLAIIREHPQCLESKFALAQLYQGSERLSQALMFLDEVLKSDPQHYMGWNNKGNIFLELKDYTQAIECYNKALQIKPNYTLAINNLCFAYLETKQYEHVIAIGERALTIEPNLPSIYHHLVKAYQEVNCIKEASLVIDKALHLFPNNPALQDIAANLTL